MTAMFGRREFLGTAAAAGLLAGCKVSKGRAVVDRSGDLRSMRSCRASPSRSLAEYPQNATILGIAKGKLAPLAHRLAGSDRRRGRAQARRRYSQRAWPTLRELDLADLAAPDQAERRGRAAGARDRRRRLRFPFGDRGQARSEQRLTATRLMS